MFFSMVLSGFAENLALSQAPEIRYDQVMKMFWTCFSIDLIVFVVLSYFFLVGLGDGTVSSYNIGLWLPLIGIPAAVLWAGLHLRRIGRLGAAKGVLALLAVPGALLGGWMLVIVVLFATHPGGHH